MGVCVWGGAAVVMLPSLLLRRICSGSRAMRERKHIFDERDVQIIIGSGECL